MTGIINKRKQKLTDTKVITEEERERNRRYILLHGEEMAEELNLRLILEAEPGISLGNKVSLQKLLSENGLDSLWGELCNQGEILFVESITVTDIWYPSEKKKAGFLMQMKKKLQSHLQRIFTYIRRLLLRFGRRKG